MRFALNLSIFWLAWVRPAYLFGEVDEALSRGLFFWVATVLLVRQGAPMWGRIVDFAWFALAFTLVVAAAGFPRFAVNVVSWLTLGPLMMASARWGLPGLWRSAEADVVAATAPVLPTRLREAFSVPDVPPAEACVSAYVRSQGFARTVVDGEPLWARGGLSGVLPVHCVRVFAESGSIVVEAWVRVRGPGPGGLGPGMVWVEDIVLDGSIGFLSRRTLMRRWQRIRELLAQETPMPALQ